MAGGRGEPMVCVAQVATAHGVRGALKLRCFTEAPENVAAYGPLHDEQGNRLFEIRIVGRTNGGVIAMAEGIGDRDAALALRGMRLYVPRSKLPEPAEDEFYHEDLIGLVAEDASGRPIGEVSAVFDFGAGDVLEITGADGKQELVPFTRAVVPTVDLAKGVVRIVLPEAVEAGGGDEAEAES
ncbi:ribosome maturation factor RimM [Benzoatithermus flavus]|uniref:Ribosome maturation factor RimM n=1 Tax=Benzoatithermus flavus TaxID=3108223 RepID=A0ABU8XWF3_9PROT